MTLQQDRTDVIGRLNDRCRLGLDRRARIVVTANCLAALEGTNLASRAFAQVMLLVVARRHLFAEGDRERDRGTLDVLGTVVRFRIDYYDEALEYGSEDPADASRTTRVMTFLLPEDD